MESRRSAYWAFQANPQIYDIERAVNELEYDVWTTKRHDVRAGDQAIIWKSLGGSSERGIVGFAEVLSGPSSDVPDDSPYWRAGSGPTDEPKVHVRYVIPPNCPVWVTPVTEPILSQLTIYRSQGSVFHVTPEQWQSVVDLVGGWPQPAALTIEDMQERLATEGEFDPATVEDARSRILSQIVLRRGQRAFRQALFDAYGGRCAITGCDVPDVLEAAHIIPYRGTETNHLENGLLFRADIHTLFDLGQVTVDEESLTVLVAPALRSTMYGEYHGKPLNLPSDSARHPSASALRHHRLASRHEEP